MSNISDEDRLALRDGFAKFLDAEAHEKNLRKALQTDKGYDEDIWKHMAKMGLLGITISEEHGGIGGGAIDVALVMEEIGKKIIPAPFVSTCLVATRLITEYAPASIQRDLLSKIASGEIIVSNGGYGDFVALPDNDNSLSVSPNGDGWLINGDVSFVIHGGSADYHLLGVVDDGTETIFLVQASGAVIATSQTTNDPAGRLSKLTCNDANAVKLENLNTEMLKNIRLHAMAALAAEQAGATRAIFDITMDYLRTRYQFGRAIGSFQAMKHMAADLLVEVESATSAAISAAKALDANSPDAAKFVALAAFTCKDAFRLVSAQAIQMHGGIAYTQEHVAHLYWRRARSNLTLYGNCDHHREEYLAAQEI